MKSFHCVVTGKVQGGNFQGWVHEQAEALGLTGWVRNIADGKAEVLVQGDEAKCKELKRRIEAESPIPGPKSVKAETIEYDKVHKKFEIRG
jgi:acylphosphatase